MRQANTHLRQVNIHLHNAGHWSATVKAHFCTSLKTCCIRIWRHRSAFGSDLTKPLIKSGLTLQSKAFQNSPEAILETYMPLMHLLDFVRAIL